MKTLKQMLALKKTCLPRGWRGIIEDIRQRYTFSRAWDELAALSLREPPRRDLLQRLWAGWGNHIYSANLEYLEEMVRRAMTVSGPVLECGSGLTTLLLGWCAGQRGLPVWTLEHDAKWYKHTATALQKYRVPNVGLCLAPLRDYGEFCWYAPPLERLPKAFSLIVCDGPPKRTTPGDRYGLLPVMREYLRSGTIILLDDVRTAAQDEVLAAWRHKIAMHEEIVENGPWDSYAIVVLD